MTNRGMKGLGAALAAASLMMMATSAHADVKCRAAVAKASAAATQSMAKALQKCEQGVHDGKVTGPCSSDPKNMAAIDKALSSLTAAINKACTTSTGEFAFGRCPNETGADGLNCGNILIQSKDGEAQCLHCLANHNAQELVHRVLYSSLLAPGSKAIAGCQAAVGKSTLAFYLAESKSLAKCQASLLKGKVTSCPDSKTQAAVDKAEAKKVAAITKSCCGPDGVCGGATCSIGSATSVFCQGGANNGVKCANSSECPGGQCSSAANETRCVGGPNGNQPCLVASECPGGTCHSGAALCEAPSDCGRCQGSTTPGKPCRSSGQCDQDPGNCNPVTLLCTGGPNNGHVCATNADCPSTPSGTCVGTTGLCGGVDDLNPISDIGVLPNVCPAITTGGAPIAFQGVTGVSLLNCVDPQSDRRAQCQDAAGATFGHDNTIPPFCVDTPVDCTPTGPTHTATVVLTTAVDLAGVSINLGYKGVNFPGTGDVSNSALITTASPHGGTAASDNDDSMTLSLTDLGNPIQSGNLFTITFSDCGSVPTPAANYGCVVRSASDAVGDPVLDGVSCSVTVP